MCVIPTKPQFGDIKALLTNRTEGATLYGATAGERGTVIAGKAAHYALLLGLPIALHGPMAALVGAAAYTVAQSVVLSTTFAVSHNVPESKPLQEGPTQVWIFIASRAAGCCAPVLHVECMQLLVPSCSTCCKLQPATRQTLPSTHPGATFSVDSTTATLFLTCCAGSELHFCAALPPLLLLNRPT
jgi:hypothetical protein